LQDILISVIIPVYNRPEQIKNAVESVLKQTYSNFELIVVDDGSTDDTPEVLSQYDAEITVFRISNSGVSAARNYGVDKASGSYIAFLDSDDEWKPKKLEKQLEFMLKGNWRISQTEEIWIRNGSFLNKRKKHEKPEGDIFIPSLQLCTVSPSAVMIKKYVYDQYGGFDETLPVCEDYDLWLRMAVREKFGLLNEKLVVKYGGHDDQLSATPAMDRYRILSLHRILTLETDLAKTRKMELIKVLTKKIEVYSNGARKRDRIKDAEWAESLLKD